MARSGADGMIAGMSGLTLFGAADTPDFWIALNDQDIVITEGVGVLGADAGDHLLIWWMSGAPGATMSISIHDGDTELLRVSGAIPPGRRMDAGLARLRISATAGPVIAGARGRRLTPTAGIARQDFDASAVSWACIAAICRLSSARVSSSRAGSVLAGAGGASSPR